MLFAVVTCCSPSLPEVPGYLAKSFSRSEGDSLSRGRYLETEGFLRHKKGWCCMCCCCSAAALVIYRFYSALYALHCILYYILFTLHSIHYYILVLSVFCTLKTLYSAFYTLYSTLCVSASNHASCVVLRFVSFRRNALICTPHCSSTRTSRESKSLNAVFAMYEHVHVHVHVHMYVYVYVYLDICV